MSNGASEKLFDMICEEMENIAEDMVRKGKLDRNALEFFFFLEDGEKNHLKSQKLQDEMEGYSQAGEWEGMARGRFGDRYDDGGNSYRGRRRDSMGRYSRARDGRDGRRMYSANGDKEEMMEHIEMMEDSASTPQVRELVKRFRKEIERI